MLIATVTCGECRGGNAAPDTPDPAGVPSSGKALPAMAPDVKAKLSRVRVVCPTANEEAFQLYNSALLLPQQEKFAEAVETYEKAIGLDPGFCDAMDNLGVLWRTAGDVKQAIYWYERSLQVRPDNPVAHQNLAVAYRIEGDAAKTAAEYRWLIQHDPDNAEGYYGLGSTYLEQGLPKLAIEPLAQAERIYRTSSSPLLVDAQYLLGTAYLADKEYLKAREYLLKAQKLGGNIPAELLQEPGMK